MRKILFGLILIWGGGNCLTFADIYTGRSYAQQVIISSDSNFPAILLSTYSNIPVYVFPIFRGTTYNTTPAAYTTWSNSDILITPADYSSSGNLQFKMYISASGATTQNFDLQVIDTNNGNASVVNFGNIAANTNVGNAAWTFYNGGSPGTIHDLVLQIRQTSVSGNAGINWIYVIIKSTG